MDQEMSYEKISEQNDEYTIPNSRHFNRDPNRNSCKAASVWENLD